ncbi:MAG: hypothetical protein HY040_27195 [Planctomycetes bacterium]|nr:hypothetical protein [Planctomycetota bacterium]
MYFWLVPLILALALAIAVLLWPRLRTFWPTVQAEKARELFKLQRERLEAQFMKAAAATGKPRGLIWKDCQWDNTVEFVRERDTGQIAALVGVTILFEAVAGGDMEGLPAVGNLRNASAVFFFHKGQWATVGKAVFNMNPDEAVSHFGHQYERLHP